MPRRSNHELEIHREGQVRPPAGITLTKDYIKDMVFALIKIKPEENIIICNICLQEITCHKCYALTTCGHGFHRDCIINGEICPVCSV